MLRDFLVGTFGKILQVLFVVVGLGLLIGGLFGGSGVGIVLGIVLLCMGAGMRYALGSIFRMR